MSAKLSFVKKIVDNDVINSYQLILSALFGNKIPLFYNEDKTYNKGDSILVMVDGTYELRICNADNVTGPFNEEKWQSVSFTELFKDGSTITQNNIIITTKQEGLVDDLATLIYNLAGLIDNRLEMNQIYKENFRNNDNLNIVIGNLQPGYIESISNRGLEFQLKNPIEIAVQPEKFKLKHFIEIKGLPSLNCEITFNALDSVPFWFSANDAILDASFFEIPEFEKEEDIPYAMNIKIKGTCNSTSSIKISDLMVVFI